MQRAPICRLSLFASKPVQHRHLRRRVGRQKRVGPASEIHRIVIVVVKHSHRQPVTCVDRMCLRRRRHFFGHSNLRCWSRPRRRFVCKRLLHICRRRRFSVGAAADVKERIPNFQRRLRHRRFRVDGPTTVETWKTGDMQDGRKTEVRVVSSLQQLKRYAERRMNCFEDLKTGAALQFLNFSSVLTAPRCRTKSTYT